MKSTCLIVSSLDKSIAPLSNLLQTLQVDNIVAAKSATTARDCLKQQIFDLVIVNAPLSDEFGSEFTMEIVSQSTSGVIFLFKELLLKEVSELMSPYGVICIAKPLKKDIFIQAISLALSTHNRLCDYEKKNKRLQFEVDSLKLIQRAKSVLMKYLNMSEEQAHYHIEKRSMDMRISKEQVAKEILKTYD